MITFLISIASLIVGYLIYGKFIERFFGANDSHIPPALSKHDGVDYVVLPTWKIFTINFLNIAGLGPIFGAVLGALYGPAAYVWIVLGCIFMGAVHDYFSGMLSMRHGGASVPEIVGIYLGKRALIMLRIFTLLLLVFVGVAFVTGPAGLLESQIPVGLNYWLAGIFGYYILATLMPIHKIIGKIYPIFGIFLLVMALSIAVAMIYKASSGELTLTELSFARLSNFHHDPQHNLLFPMLFIVVSCGAISGFHATQTPMMARCLKKESHGRYAFYGAMIAEGILSIIWATAAMNFYGGVEELNHSVSQGFAPARIVKEICNSWLGVSGALIAIVGVVVCPITTGDTAFRSARLAIADMFHVKQESLVLRLMVSVPLFIAGFILSRLEFSVIWRYLGLSNQVLSVIILWTISSYLQKQGKWHWLVSIPAAFMTTICISYIFVAPYQSGGLAFNPLIGTVLGGAGGLICLAFFVFSGSRRKKLT